MFLIICKYSKIELLTGKDHLIPALSSQPAWPAQSVRERGKSYPIY